jgi:hypothetical protein
MPIWARVLGRYFFTGQELWGPGDNATFLHRATVDYRARPYTTLTGPKWQRLTRRHAAFAVPLLLLAAGWKIAAGYLALLLLAAIAWTVRTAIRKIRDRRAAKEFMRPAAQVLCSLIGYRYTKRRAGELVQRAGDGWRVAIPAGTALSPRLKTQITTNVGARLGLGKTVQADWREDGTAVCAVLRPIALPPDKIEFTTLLDRIEKLEDHEWLAGIKPGNHSVVCSLNEDSPHILISGSSGTGKSVLVRSLAVQRLLRGDGVIITDPKRFSHWRWAGGGKLSTDRVVYAYRDADLHDTWLAVGEEIKRRIELDEWELEEQRRIFVIVEEANVQTKKLRRYWRGLRKEIILAAKQAQADDGPFEPADLDPPAESPAVAAMQEAICMGREIKIHVVVAAQRASANVFGGNGGDMRESFQGGRFIARWDRRLWKMLVDTIDYVACPPGGRGLWGLARGEEFEIFRVPWLAERMATELVLAKAPVATGHVLGRQNGHGQIDGHVAKPELANPVTLAMAVGQLPGQDGPMAITLRGLRDAAVNSAGFPAPLDKGDGTPYGRTEARLYDLEELIHWREHVIAGRAAVKASELPVRQFDR